MNPRRTTFLLALLLVAPCMSCRRSPPGDPRATTESRASAPDLRAFRMIDVSGDSGVDFVTRSADPPRFIPEAKGTGVAIIDYDRDGILDLFFVSGSTVERERAGEPGFGSALYRGIGGLRYRDATAEAGIPDLGWSSAPIAGDLDGDGFDDLLVTGLAGIRLLANRGGRFEETTVTALPVTARHAGWCTGATLFDLDNDGDLDVLVPRYLRFDWSRPPVDGEGGRVCRWKEHSVICGPRGMEPLHALLLVNRGDGTFEDGTATSGIDAVPAAYGLGAIALDFDRDGRTDVYVANDMTPSHLWHNQGTRFAEVGVALGVAYSADGAPEAGMGLDAADLNGDGIEDILKTNFEGEPNDLYLSSKAAGFIESSMRAGIAPVDRPHVGWGCAIRDFDGDGILDLFVVNGHVYPQADLPGTGTAFAQPKVLELGGASGRFRRFAAPGSEALALRKVSRAAAFGDLDDDGDTDVVVVNLNDRPTILRADVPDRPWIGLSVQGPPKNRHGIGATVTLSVDGSTQTRYVRAQASFQSTNDPRLIFRLPSAASRAAVEVALPGAGIRRFADLRSGQWHVIRIE